MKKFIYLIIIFISSCTSNFDKNNFDNKFNSIDSMTFEEFKLKLNDYAKNNPYPKIDD
jgi:hypothetical protein